ncbi:hypothetical protein BGX38DRAFT_1269535 [Terfezia claveryi]|nr:hypothetical protein BGX38DRAFT_1269535 [Terfezia claveryi]
MGSTSTPTLTPTSTWTATTISPTGNSPLKWNTGRNKRKLPWVKDTMKKNSRTLGVVGVNVVAKAHGSGQGGQARIVEDVQEEDGQFESDIEDDDDDVSPAGSPLFHKITYKYRNLEERRATHVKRAKSIAEELYQIKLKDWQAGIPWDLKKGKDVICVVGTGAGKTMIVVMYSALFGGDYILFISPLVALMESQVLKFSEQGIMAICLTNDYINAHPDIWKDIA